MKKRKSTFVNFLLNSFRKVLWLYALLFFRFTCLVIVIASSRIF